MAFQSAVVDAYDDETEDATEDIRGPDEVPVPFQNLSGLVSDLLNATTDINDTDGDGLPDSVERVIGTDWNNSDSDVDDLSDHFEVFNNMDPLNPDSNGDKLADYYEVHNVKLDADGDGVPNAWDWDNDGDGVMDDLDLSPFSKTGISGGFHLEINTTGKPTYINFQLRTNDPEHMRLIEQVWDWPNDTRGTVRDLDGSIDDVNIVPLLNFKANVVPDQADVEDFAITVHDDTAMIPVFPEWEFGNIVAFRARMFYPENVSLRNISADVELTWRVNGKTDNYVRAIQAPNGLYLSTDEDGAIVANATHVDGHQLFDWVVAGEDSVALRGANGKFLTVEANGSVSSTVEKMDERSVFRTEDGPSSTTLLKAHNDKYVKVYANGTLFADEGNSGLASPFVVVDRGERPDIVPLVSYMEDFMLTGFSVTEDFGAKAGLFYSSDKEQVLAANLALSYDFLRNGTYELEEMPAHLRDNKSVTVDHNISSFSHRDEAVLALSQGMIEDAVKSLPPGEVLPVVAALEDNSTHVDLYDLCAATNFTGSSLVTDMTGLKPITSRTLKTTWYNTSTDDPLELDEVVQEIRKWNVTEDARTTLIALSVIWGVGETVVVREGAINKQYQLSDVNTVDTTIADVTLEGIVVFQCVIDIIKHVQSTYYVCNPSRWTHLSRISGTQVRSVADAVEAVSMVKTGAIGVVNRIGDYLEIIGILIDVAIVIWSMVEICKAIGWTSVGVGISLAYGYLMGIYVLSLACLAIAGGPVGAIIASLIALSDLLAFLMCGSTWSEMLIGELLGVLIDWFSEVNKFTEVTLDLINSTAKVEDLDKNGLDAGDRITYISHIYGIVTECDEGGYDDLVASYIKPIHTASVPLYSGSNVTTWSNESTPVFTSGKKTTEYETGAQVEPGIGMVNFPIAIGIQTAYKVLYEECWWYLFVQSCDDKEATGTTNSHYTTLYFDIMPGSIDEFATWRGITSCDFDGDGINNTNETTTNPWNWDTDGDGLGDKYELDIDSNPAAPDTDMDGIDDNSEHRLGLNITSKDTDGDGLSDYIEQTGWIVDFNYSSQQFHWHINSDGRCNDTDGDGLNDWLEYFCLLNPKSYDTDGDGTNDSLRDYYATSFSHLDTIQLPSDPDFDTGEMLSCVVDSHGNLYVLIAKEGSYNENITVFVYDAKGMAIDSWGDFRYSLDMYIDSNDTIYMGYNRPHYGETVDKFSTDGTNLGSVCGGIGYGAVAVDEKNGYLYFNDNELSHICKYHLNGTLIANLSIVSGTHVSTGGMDVDDEGNLYVPVPYWNRDTLLRWNSNGTVKTVLCSRGYAEGQVDDPMDIVVDQHGDLLVVEMANHRVQKLSNEGRWLGTFGSYGTNNTSLNAPTSLFLDGENLYILDDGNHRIQKILYEVELVQAQPSVSFADPDGDGLSTQEEEAGWEVNSTNSSSGPGLLGDRGGTVYRVFSDPMNADTDGDGISDYEEFIGATDPRTIDTDRDGISDAREALLGTNATHCDTDGDLLEDGVELTFGSDPKVVDTDGEGLSDMDEFLHGSDPNNEDSDWDGLDDAAEVAFGSNLTNPDEDGDFMFDSKERELGTLPDKPDFDDDGIDDGYELLYDTSPKNPDTDGDDLLDGDEIAMGLNPLSNDTDGDGLTDSVEVDRGLNPLSKDTDGDGVPDGLDLDFQLQLGEDVYIVMDDGARTSEFYQDLSKGVDLVQVTPGELLDDHRDRPYIVLVGWPEEGNGMAGGIIHDILSKDAPDLLERMTGSNYSRLMVRYGKWAETQTIVMLSCVQRSDHNRVMGILKSMSVTVRNGSFSAEYFNPRSCFVLDQFEAVMETDTVVTTKLDEMAVFSVDLVRHTNETLPVEMSNETGLEPVEVAVGKYVEVSVSERLQNDTGDIITGAKIELFYTVDDLDWTGDGDTDDPDDLNESSLGLYVLDEGAGNWTRLTEGLDWVNSTGVNTTDVTLYGREYAGCVWAYVMHLSTFGIAGRQYRVLPTSARAGSDLVVYEGDEVAFNGTASSGNGLIVDHVWTFEYEGEPVTLLGPMPTFMFEVAGVYTVTLTVTDYLGHEGTDTLVVTVNEIPPGKLVLKVGPVTDEEGDPLEGASVNITIGEDTYSNVTDSQGIARFELDETVVGSDVAIAIAMEGYESAEYGTLINSEGMLDQDPPALVRTGEVLPTVARPGSDLTALEGDEVSLDGSASEGNEGIANYTWTFEYDGATVTLYGPRPSFVFEVVGVYNVTLNVTDGLGLTDEASLTITINERTTPPPETFMLRVGPVLDEDLETLIGATVKISVSGQNLTNTTDEFGYALIELGVGLVGSDVMITIEMPGYNPGVYTTSILANKTLAEPPPKLVKQEATPPPEDEGEISLAVVAGIAVAVVLVLLILFFILGRAAGGRGGREEDELGEVGIEPVDMGDVEAPLEEDEDIVVEEEGAPEEGEETPEDEEIEVSEVERDQEEIDEEVEGEEVEEDIDDLLDSLEDEEER